MKSLRERAIKFIANPISGNGKTRRILPKLILLVKKLGIRFDVELTQAPQHATEIAKNLSDEFEIVVAVGGDGTINEVASGLLLTDKVLGIVPTGSGNDFARTLGRLRNLKEWVYSLIAGSIKRIDVGTINLGNRDYVFVNGVGIGFDAEVARQSEHFRRLKGLPRYLAALIKTLKSYRSTRMNLEIDGQVARDGQTFLVAIGNGTSAGGGFLLTPDAKLDDGLLDVCAVNEVSIPRVIQVLPSVLNGTHLKHPEVSMYKAHHIKIISDDPVAIHRDGEIAPARVQEFTVDIHPDSLNIIA
ncbi:MAG: diacylglycerol/lipid kinase family protein [Candidatus Kryptoniota bacterium]